MRRLLLSATPSDEGERLDRFIALKGGVSRGLARRVLERGGVFLDGRRCKVASRLVRAGQEVVVNLEESGRSVEAPAALERTRLLFLDEHLVAVDKPAFVAAQPTLTTDRGVLPELVGDLLRSKVTPVHRLDRQTSGVTLLARSPRAMAALTEAFRERTVEKTYLALCAAAPRPAEGRLEAPLGPDPTRPGRRRVCASGEEAVTRYQTLRTGPSGTSLVLCSPETGRTHQIRAHLAYLGAPLLGDVRYGGPRSVLGVDVPRVMLHARRLCIDHPFTKAPLVFEAPVPDDFLLLLRALVPAGSAPEAP
ncbi:MAG TPA: RluA family pseudouridine synthase [Anaeromyxobacteraceae bacterium]|nr:RluA family pseudouridine synthase [Anaeromyxobacteraceae bacterium]